MRRAIYLDFSAPLFERDSDLNTFSSHIKDLARYLHKTRNTKFYISLTVEFVTTFRDHLEPLIEALKELIREERVEFAVKDSFNVNSLSLPRNVSEFNFIFNEYLLGYFFGDKRNFEGEPSIMIKNLSTISVYKGILKESDVKFLTEMGYSNFMVDKKLLSSSSFINGSLIFIEVDFEFSKLFSTFVEKEALDAYLLENISHNYMIYYVNPYKIFLENRESFNINTSNLFHILDLTDKVEYRFADEAFEMPVLKDTKLLEVGSFEKDELYSCQNKLAGFMKLNLPENFDTTMFDDLRTASLWDATGNKLIDEYLRTSFLMLTMLSQSVNDKIKLLNKHLVVHLSTILDELEIYSSNNEELKKSIQDYRSYINQN